MSFTGLRIMLCKGWTYIICSLSVALLTLVSCRSKKVTKTPDETGQSRDPAEVVDEYMTTRAGNLAKTPVMPGDSREVQDMIRQVNSLKKDLSDRMNSVIYGTPEMMQRRAQENRVMRARIDSIDNLINKTRLK